MRLSAQAFRQPKAGSSEEEYEDDYWPRCRLESASRAEFRFAVADGATEASFSRLWAKLLASSFVYGTFGGRDLRSELGRIQHRWHTSVRAKRLPWYAEEKVKQGAAAAFIGLRVWDNPQSDAAGSWEALALGDSCLAQVRGDELIKAFPISTADAFSNAPYLLSSNPAHVEGCLERLNKASETWLPDDSLYLMTDALAAWFFREVERDAAPWEVLRDFDTKDGMKFPAWVADLRSARTMRNDDVTLVRIDLHQ